MCLSPAHCEPFRMSNPNAYLLIRNLPHYRREVFTEGLQRAGFAVHYSQPTYVPCPRPGDAMVIWNRYGPNENLARHMTRHGAAVIVAENGYLPMRDTKKSFALALQHHNGAGRWFIGPEPRIDLLDVEQQPWIERRMQDRGDILLLPQRGIGPAGIAMPRDWIAAVTRRLRAQTNRNIRIRPHPGNAPEKTELTADIQGVGVCVTWASGAGLKSLLLGVPTVFEMELWIGARGGSFGVNTVDQPRLGDRARMLERLAWAQWSAEEVATGVPFCHLMRMHREKQVEEGAKDA